MYKRALLVFGLVAIANACGRQDAPSARPNIVLISLDTLRADYLGAYGQQRPTSPSFDRFAREAIVFENAFSHAPMTAPSHMTLFTSLYPSVHRINNLGTYANPAKDQPGEVTARLRIDPDVTTLAEVLCARGWRTAAFHGGGNINRQSGFEDGFESFDGRANNGMNGNAEQLFDISRAAQWIEEHRGEPFFLFLHTYVPHAPYIPPPPWDRAFDPDYAGAIPDRGEFLHAMASGDPGPPLPGAEASPRRQRMTRHDPWQFWGWVDPDDPREIEHLRALYAGDVRTCDDALEDMLEAIGRTGIAERTLVVVLSDHGESFLERGTLEHGGKLYRELLHVPLALRVPGKAAARITMPVGLIDLMPTLLELADVPAPSGMQGRSFASALDGSASGREDLDVPEVPEVPEVIGEFIRRWRQVGDSLEPEDIVQSLRDERWTYLIARKAGQTTEELYDRQLDPEETRDLASDPARAADLARLRQRLAAHAESCARERRRVRPVEAGELDPSTMDALRRLGYAR